MSKSYKPVSEWAKATFGDDEFEHDFSAVDEGDMLSAGHLQPVPQRYRVLSDNYYGHEQGDEFDGFFRREVEEALVSGGQLKRVDKPKPAKKPAAKKAAEKSD